MRAVLEAGDEMLDRVWFCHELLRQPRGLKFSSLGYGPPGIKGHPVNPATRRNHDFDMLLSLTSDSSIASTTEPVHM
jgi:hypothetical protein